VNAHKRYILFVDFILNLQVVHQRAKVIEQPLELFHTIRLMPGLLEHFILILNLWMESLVLKQLLIMKSLAFILYSVEFSLVHAYFSPYFFLEIIEVSFGISKLNLYFIADLIGELFEMLANYQQYLFFIDLIGYFYLVVLFIKSFVQIYFVVVSLSLLISQMINVYPHGQKLLALYLHYLFCVTLLHQF